MISGTRSTRTLRRWKSALGHSLFWIMYVILNGLRTPTPRGGPLQLLIESLLFLPVIMSATYFTLYVLAQKYLLRGKHLQFAVYFVVSALCFTTLSRSVSYYIVVPLHYPHLAERYYEVAFFAPATMLTFLLSLYTVVAYAGVILYVWKWYENEKAKQQLSKEKLEAELRFLRAQIHPHFLFNMLNNVYALSLKKSDQTPQMLLKISSLLDFMLYRSNANSVPLHKEVELIQNYLEIERIRYGDRINISLHIAGGANGHYIAPLILFPFVENSFKHGVSAGIENGWINLTILVRDDTLWVKIENSKTRSVGPDLSGASNGIGFNNALRRLDLLYPGRYTLDAIDKGSQFVVELSLQLRPYPEVEHENSMPAD